MKKKKNERSLNPKQNKFKIKKKKIQSQNKTEKKNYLQALEKKKKVVTGDQHCNQHYLKTV